MIPELRKGRKKKMKDLIKGIIATLIILVLFYILGVVVNFLAQHIFIAILTSIFSISLLFKL